MSFINIKFLTPSEAKDLIHKGFVLKLIKVMVSKDLYQVWVL